MKIPAFALALALFAAPCRPLLSDPIDLSQATLKVSGTFPEERHPGKGLKFPALYFSTKSDTGGRHGEYAEGKYVLKGAAAAAPLTVFPALVSESAAQEDLEGRRALCQRVRLPDSFSGFIAVFFQSGTGSAKEMGVVPAELIRGYKEVLYAPERTELYFQVSYGPTPVEHDLFCFNWAKKTLWTVPGDASQVIASPDNKWLAVHAYTKDYSGEDHVSAVNSISLFNVEEQKSYLVYRWEEKGLGSYLKLEGWGMPDPGLKGHD